MVLTKAYSHFPYPLNYIALVLAIIHIFQIIIISIIKVIYSINKLIKNPEEFEVRNSPLNKYASHLAKLFYCWKFSCNGVTTGLGVIAAGATIDQVLDEAGYDKVFLSYLAKNLQIVWAPKGDNPKDLYDKFIQKSKALLKATEEEEYLIKAVENISNEDFNRDDLTDSDKLLIKQGIS